MGKKNYRPEQIIRLLRQVEILLSQGPGRSVRDVCREIGISDNSYYKWRKEYGGLLVSQVKRLKDLEKENGRLKRAVADLTLDNIILKDVFEGKY